MEYKEIYDILYDMFCDIFPRDVIHLLIFKYVVNSNTYNYLRTLQSDEYFYDVHVNRQLKIMCLISSRSYRLIDYETGEDHDNSVIDIKSIPSPFRNSMLYFDNDILLMYMNYSGCYKYVLNNTKYLKTHFDHNSRYYYIYVYDERIYRINHENAQYYITVYELHDLKKIAKSIKYSYNGGPLLITVHEDKICVCWNNNRYPTCNVHDINSFSIIHHYYCHKQKCNFYATGVYKNKLYMCTSNQIFVHDILTCEQLHSFRINGYQQNKQYYMSISNDIIMLSFEGHMIFYNIK
jgi:WD40 repeat protein